MNVLYYISLAFTFLGSSFFHQAALLTFIATASGMSWFGLASAFWGILIGMCAALLFNPKLRGGIRSLLKKA
ncbi:benzoate/H(+) symporter BenE family transporter [Oligella sp. HMSC09E12]|uniref:benzoate/H(+) symporter BenE family transporter n=1 Tax=Oligella TaxID=90243 RepID=UPI00352C9FC9